MASGTGLDWECQGNEEKTDRHIEKIGSGGLGPLMGKPKAAQSSPCLFYTVEQTSRVIAYR